jgi:catechol 2,3-dioxygenase-like lactoylglutathione lyase family enzyme
VADLVPRLGQTIPALPVRSVPAAAAFYRERLGFTIVHEDRGFAIVVRDESEIHLWGATDTSWSERGDLRVRPVCSGAESFIAGTASCRIAVVGVDELYAELRIQDVLHSPSTVVVDTDYGTREFPTLDCDGNLISFYTRVRPRAG